VNKNTFWFKCPPNLVQASAWTILFHLPGIKFQLGSELAPIPGLFAFLMQRSNFKSDTYNRHRRGHKPHGDRRDPKNGAGCLRHLYLGLFGTCGCLRQGSTSGRLLQESKTPTSGIWTLLVHIHCNNWHKWTLAPGKA